MLGCGKRYTSRSFSKNKWQHLGLILQNFHKCDHQNCQTLSKFTRKGHTLANIRHNLIKFGTRLQFWMNVFSKRWSNWVNLELGAVQKCGYPVDLEQVLQNGYSCASIGFDIAETEPFQVFYSGIIPGP